jgi:hypothetical protein
LHAVNSLEYPLANSWMLGRDINVNVPAGAESPNGGAWDFARYVVLFPAVNNPPCEDGAIVVADAAPLAGTVRATVANSFKSCSKRIQDSTLALLHFTAFVLGANCIPELPNRTLATKRGFSWGHVKPGPALGGCFLKMDDHAGLRLGPTNMAAAGITSREGEPPFLSVYDAVSTADNSSGSFVFEWVAAGSVLRWRGGSPTLGGVEQCLSFDTDNHTRASLAPTRGGQPSNSLRVLPAVLRPCAVATGWAWGGANGSLQPLRDRSLCLMPQPLLGQALLLPCGAEPWGALPHDMTPPPHPACEGSARSDEPAVRHEHYGHDDSRENHHRILASSTAGAQLCTNGTDIAPSHDLPSSYPGCRDAAACAASCRHDTRCQAWVFDACFRSMCYLKSASQPRVPKACVCSATMPAPAPTPQWLLLGSKTGRHCSSPKACGDEGFVIRTAQPFSMHQSHVNGALGAKVSQWSPRATDNSALPKTDKKFTARFPQLLPAGALLPAAVRFAALGTVRPAGWMRRQLEAQRWGFAGNEYGLKQPGNYSNESAWIDGETTAALN